MRDRNYLRRGSGGGSVVPKSHTQSVMQECRDTNVLRDMDCQKIAAQCSVVEVLVLC